MINSESLREIIETKLNATAQKLAAPFKFRIFSNVGDFEAAIEDPTRQSLPTPLINGIIIDYASEIAPLSGITSYSMSQGLTLYVPRTPNPIAGEGIDRALAVIQSFVQNTAGLAENMDAENADGVPESYAYVLAPELPSVGSEDNTLGIWATPVDILLTWQFIKDGVTGNAVKVTIDDVEAKILSGGFALARILATDQRENDKFVTSITGQQTLSFQAQVPYIKGSVGETLVKDMFAGGLTKVYTVKLTDGVIYTDDKPVTLKMNASEISFNFAPGTVCSVDASFALEEDPETEDETN